MPRQGKRIPWRVHNNYVLDKRMLGECDASPPPPLSLPNTHDPVRGSPPHDLPTQPCQRTSPWHLWSLVRAIAIPQHRYHMSGSPRSVHLVLRRPCCRLGGDRRRCAGIFAANKSTNVMPIEGLFNFSLNPPPINSCRTLFQCLSMPKRFVVVVLEIRDYGDIY